MVQTEEVSYYRSYRLTAAILRALRQELDARDFTEITPAPLSELYEPGARHAVAVLGNRALPGITKLDGNGDDYVEVRGESSYFLPVSHAVEKQFAMEYLERAYCVTPCVRLLMDDEPEGGRHLFTFFQFEVEWRTADVEEVFQLGEELLAGVGRQLLGRTDVRSDATVADRLGMLTRRAYSRIEFREIDRDGEVKGDLSRDEETALAKRFDRPFWIWHYPPGIRDSLYRRNVYGTYDTYDLMLPLGHGELATGGCRPESGAEILRQSAALGREVHPAYARWKERTGVQSAGFGIGLERLVHFCAGTPDITHVVNYHDSGPNTRLRGLGRRER